jgi:hypothetical protein
MGKTFIGEHRIIDIGDGGKHAPKPPEIAAKKMIAEANIREEKQLREMLDKLSGAKAAAGLAFARERSPKAQAEYLAASRMYNQIRVNYFEKFAANKDADWQTLQVSALEMEKGSLTKQLKSNTDGKELMRIRENIETIDRIVNHITLAGIKNTINEGYTARKLSN